MKGIDDCSYEEFQYALAVGVTAPFYLTKLFVPYFAEGGAIVNISSSRDRIRAYDGEGKLDKRMEVRPRHLEGMKKLSERIISAGGLVCFNRIPIGL